MRMFWPVFPCQYPAKAALNSTYSSRVGSYETFSSVRVSAPAPPPDPQAASAVNPAPSNRAAAPRRVMEKVFICGLLTGLELRLHGHAPGARVGRLARDQAGVARGGGQLLEVLLVEGILHPAVHVPAAVAPEAKTEVGQAIASHVGVDRTRGVRGEAAAGVAIIGEVQLA